VSRAFIHIQRIIFSPPPNSVIPMKIGTQLSMYRTLKFKARHAALVPDFRRDDELGVHRDDGERG
jgi:hypothetical protein